MLGLGWHLKFERQPGLSNGLRDPCAGLCPFRRRERFDLGDQSSWQAREQILQIIIRVDTVPPATSQQCVDNCAAFTGVGMSNEHPISPSKCAGPNAVLNFVIIVFQKTVGDKPRQRFPTLGHGFDFQDKTRRRSAAKPQAKRSAGLPPALCDGRPEADDNSALHVFRIIPQKATTLGHCTAANAAERKVVDQPPRHSAISAERGAATHGARTALSAGCSRAGRDSRTRLSALRENLLSTRRCCEMALQCYLGISRMIAEIFVAAQA